MGCRYQPECGGCCFRDKTEAVYRALKAEKVRHILETALKQKDYIWHEPVFLADGQRRRITMAFLNHGGKTELGFNENRSAKIIDCQYCPAVTAGINAALPGLRSFLEKFCASEALKAGSKTGGGKKGKVKKYISRVCGGDVSLLQADNGLDVVLEYDNELTLDQRMEIFEYVNGEDNIIRFSHRRKNETEAEPVIEKTKPIIKIGGCDVFVAPGTFLQASKAGEEALTALVVGYLGDTRGKIADLFCGIGTFSYPLAVMPENKIVAADESESLLKGFQHSVNRQMLHNIEIVQRNLFKYPFSGQELKGFTAVVFDPPRAGAAAQVKELASLEESDKPKKIIAISCNPHSFVNDANVLIEGGYCLREVTMVDQFVYSNHSELAALFTK